MKKNIKKIIVGIFALGALFLAQGVFASTWNGASNDCPSINVANATTGAGWSDPCWTGTNISASPGDVVNVRIYYHNTGTVTATNTKVFLNADTSSTTSHKFTGSITSNQGNLALPSVYINTNPAQSLSFDTVKWYTENTKETLTSLLGGQSGSEVLSGGLLIGSIAPGWATQGSVVISFKVNKNQEPPEPKVCSITSFTATPSTITNGSFSNLSWTTTNCNSANIQGIGAVPASFGSKTMYPTSTTTYSLTAYGDNNQDAATAKVTVNQIVNPMSGDLSASPSSCTIPIGNSTCAVSLSWNTTNPVGVSAVTNLNGTIATGNSGNKAVSITNGTTSYYLYNNGEKLDTENVTASCTSGSSWNGSYCVLNTTDTNDCVVTSFQAIPSSITKGDSSIISWTTSNCTTLAISGIGTYGLAKNGSQVVWPASTRSYTISAVGSNGSTSTQTTTVNVGEQETSSKCKIIDFSASKTDIEEGDSTRLRWDTTDCTRVRISDIGSVDEDGTKTVSPKEDTTYTLTAFNTDGSSVKSTVRIYVDGEDGQSGDSCSINSFKTSDSYIDQGELSKLTWRTTNCKNVTITNIGRVPESGSEIVYPSATTTYILRAYGDKNNDTETLKINVGQDYIYEYNTSVVTTVATNVTQSSASLNGLLTNTSSSSQNVYFDYGTTVNMGSRTNSKNVSGSVNFTEYVSGLAPNTIYFFQAVSSGSNGISRGAIEVFRTPGYAVNYNTGSSSSTSSAIRVVQGTTITGSASPVMLEIENKYQILSRGDFMEYVVYYKNISNSTLSNPMVQVYIPEGITVTNTSAGTYSKNDRILSVPIQDLKPQEEGIIYIQAKIDFIDSTRAQIVTTAILIYTNPNGAQENAMAYVLNNPGDGSSNLLGASAFQGGFLGLSLIGWLILALLILLIVLITRTYYNKEPINR